MNLGSARGEIAIDYTGQAAVQSAMRDLNTLAGIDTGRAFEETGRVLTNVGQQGAEAVGSWVSAAGDFEFQMDAVNAALGGIDPSGMEQVTQQALDLGKATQFSAGEVAGVQEQLAKSGLTADELANSSGGATKAVLDLAAATGEGLQPAAVSTAAALNLFDLNATQTADVADILTAALNSSSATLPDLQRGINALGPVMANLNAYANDGEKAFRDTAAAVAYFNSQGLKAADAGVSIARGMTQLADPTSAASVEMAKAGVSAFDAAGNLLPLDQIMDQLSVGMKDYSDQAKIAALTTIFGAEAADVMAIAIKKGGAGLREYEAATTAAGQAAAQARIRQDNLNGAIEQLSGSVNTLKVELGQSMIAPIRSVTEGLTALANAAADADPAILAFVTMTTAAASGFALIAGGAALAVGQILKLSAAFSSVGLSLGRFILGMGLAGLAIAALVAAYETNFLGFGDLVDKTIGGAVKALKTFAVGMKSFTAGREAAGFNKLAAAVGAFGDALNIATGIDITGFTNQLATGIQAFGDSLEHDLAAGFALLPSIINAVALALGKLGFGDLAAKVHDAAVGLVNFGNVLGDLGGRFDALLGAGFDPLTAALLLLSQTASDLGLDDFAQKLSDLAGVTNALANEFESLIADGLNPVEAALITARDAIESLTGIDLEGFFNGIGDAVSGIPDALGNIAGTIRDVAAAVVSGDFSRVGDILGAAIQQFRDFAGPQIREALDALGTAISSIDIAQIAINVGAWVAGKWDDLKTWLEGTTGVDLGDGIDIGDVQVALSWAAGKWDDLSAWIEEQTGVDFASIDIGDVIVNIGKWIVNSAQSISEAVANFIGQSSANSMGGPGERGESGTASAGIPIGDVALQIQEWIITSATSAPEAVAQWINDQIPDIDAAAIAAAKQAGDDIGAKLGEALGAAISAALNAVMSSGGGRGQGVLGTLDTGTGAELASQLDFEAMVSGFADGFFNGFSRAFAAQTAQARARLGPFVAEQIRGLIEGILTTPLVPTSTAGPGDPTNAGSQLGEYLNDQLNLGTVGDVIKAGAESAAAKNEAAAGEAIKVGVVDPVNAAAVKETQGDPFTAIGDLADGAATTLNDFWNLVSGKQHVGAAEASTALERSIVGPIDEVGPQVQAGLSAGIGKLASDIDLEQPVGDMLTAETEQMTLEEFSKSIGVRINEAILEGVSGSADTMGGPGERGEAGTASAGIASQIAGQIASSIDSAPPEAFAAIGSSLMLKIQDAISTSLSGAGATGPVGPEAVGKGVGMAAAIVNGLASSISSAIANSAPENFSAIGLALMTKIQEAINTAMSGAVSQGISPTGAGPSIPTEGGIGSSIVTSLATSIANSISTAPVESFAPIGQALNAQISAALQVALIAAPSALMDGGKGMTGGGTAGANLGGGATEMMTALATQIAASITAAPIETFAAIGTALNAKITEALNSAMSTSPSAAMGGGKGMTGTGGGTGGGIGTQIATMIATDVAGADFSSVATALQTALTEPIQTAFKELGTVITTAFTTLQTSVDTGVTGLQTSLQAIVTAIQGITTAIGTALQAMQTTITNSFTALQTAVDTAISGIQTSIQAIVPAIEGIATAVGTAMQGMITTVTDAFAQMQSAVDTAVSGIQTSVSAIVTVLNQVAADAGAAAGAIGDAIVTALNEDTAAVAAAAAALGAAAVVPINSAIQPGSPSKVVLPWAESIPEALVTGMSEGIPAVEDASAALGDAATEGVTDGLTTAIDTGVEAAGSALEQARSLFEEYGMTFGNDLGEALGKSMGNVAGNANLDRLTGLADKLRSNAEERVAHLQGLGDRIRENHGMVRDAMNAQSQDKTQPVQVHVLMELDGEALDEKIVDVGIGQMVPALDRVGKSPRSRF